MTATAQRQGFSLCEGGRFHAALVRAGFAGGARGRLILVAVMIAVGWLPLMVLASLDGTALGGVDHPLVRDIGAWVRFFLVVPLLVFVEPLADRRLGLVVEQFRLSGLVPAEHRQAFENEVGTVQRRATSDTVELVLIAIALTLPHLAQATAPRWLAGQSSWLGVTGADGGLDPSAAGRWLLWLSLPLVEFLFLRWLWRIVAWWRFLWRVSRLPLDLAPSHPDRSGGLGFLADAPLAFVPVFVAVSAAAAASVAAQIAVGGGTLTDAKAEVAAVVIIALILLVVPQFFFLPVQGLARQRALRRFEATGAAMSRAFEDRWTGPAAEGPDGILESGGSGAMADFASTYDRVAAMRAVSLSLREFLRVAVPLAIPFTPLLLYQFSVKEILQRVLQLIR